MTAPIGIAIQNIRPASRKLTVRFANVANFLWDTQDNVGYGVAVTTNIVQPTPLLDYAPVPALTYPKKKKKKNLLLCAPKLVFDAVTRHLLWEHITYEQKLVDETEERMTGRYVWGMDPGLGLDWTVTEEIGQVRVNRRALQKLYEHDLAEFQQQYQCQPMPALEEVGDKNHGGDRCRAE